MHCLYTRRSSIYVLTELTKEVSVFRFAGTSVCACARFRFAIDLTFCLPKSPKGGTRTIAYATLILGPLVHRRRAINTLRVAFLYYYVIFLLIAVLGCLIPGLPYTLLIHLISVFYDVSWVWEYCWKGTYIKGGMSCHLSPLQYYYI